MVDKFKEKIFYVCNYCKSVFDGKEMIEQHLVECLQNYDDVHTCVACKHSILNLVAPTDKDNGYTSVRLQEVVGPKAYLSCGKGIYEGKISEDKILREDKQCYVPMDEGELFEVNHTKGYTRYKRLLAEAEAEEKAIDAEILEWHKLANELRESDYSEEEIKEILEEKYKDE